jgi:F0F1-type ATP synthase assembly protein I
MNRMPSAVSLLGIGWYFAVSIIGGIVGGLLLDGWLDTKPLFTIVGLFVGLAVAFYGGFRAVMRVMAETNANTKGTEKD